MFQLSTKKWYLRAARPEAVNEATSRPPTHSSLTPDRNQTWMLDGATGPIPNA